MKNINRPFSSSSSREFVTQTTVPCGPKLSQVSRHDKGDTLGLKNAFFLLSE